MSHLGPVVTDYIDNTLDPTERASIEAHLATCSACRRDVELATAGREAAKAAADVEVPPGLADAAIAEAARPATVAKPADGRGGRAVTPRWAVAAGVAAVVALLALTLPKLGNSNDLDSAGASRAAAPQTALPQATAVEISRANVGQAQLADLASTLRTPPESAAPRDSFGAATGGVALPTTSIRSSDPGRLDEAAACLAQAAGQTPGDLARVVAARYEGKPAYFGLYAVGPGAGLPPTRIQLVVASVKGCDLLATSYALL